MPIGPPAHLPEPKSGWRPIPVPIVAMTASEFDAAGSESTLMFHGLSAGNTGHPPTFGAAAEPLKTKAAETAPARSLVTTALNGRGARGRRRHPFWALSDALYARFAAWYSVSASAESTSPSVG